MSEAGKPLGNIILECWSTRVFDCWAFAHYSIFSNSTGLKRIFEIRFLCSQLGGYG